MILGLALFALFVDEFFETPSDCIHSVIYVQRTANRFFLLPSLLLLIHFNT